MSEDQVSQSPLKQCESERERHIQKLVNWAKRHTELGSDLMNQERSSSSEALRQLFVASLEQGRELLMQQNLLSLDDSGRVRSSVPPLPGVRQDMILPLSGSGRFGECGHPEQFAKRLDEPSGKTSNVSARFARSTSSPASHSHFRSVPLVPSRNYRKKKQPFS